MQTMVFALLLFVTAPLALAQPLPPDPHDVPGHDSFFKALPHRFPAPNLDALAPQIADDLQVFREGELLLRSKKAWLDDLQSGAAPKAPDSPQGYSVERTYVGVTPDGGVIASEFTMPIPPEGQIVIYHPVQPRRFATYYFKGRKLVRIVYTNSAPPRLEDQERGEPADTPPARSEQPKADTCPECIALDMPLRTRDVRHAKSAPSQC